LAKIFVLQQLPWRIEVIDGRDDRKPAAAQPEWRLERHDGEAVLAVSGDWLIRESGLHGAEEVGALSRGLDGCMHLRFATAGLAHWDSALVSFVWSVQSSVQSRGLTLDLSGLPEALRRLLALANAEHGENLVDELVAKPRLRERIGTWVFRDLCGLTAMADLLGETVLSIAPALRKRGGTRGDVIGQMQASGIGALGIVAVVNSLVGAILAFVGAVQLQRFGAGGYIADLVGIAVVREMAPIMTAIVMAGRTGGAYAAEIATMQGNEEIDALYVAGISPFHYLVLPRVTALVTMMPLLYVYACLVGIGGGFVVGFSMLAISPMAFLVHLQSAIPPSEFIIGFTKSICFGAFIALASCQIGLRAGRGATDVGDAATRAVVAGIVGVIGLDAIFAACANVLGI
jgi:phospholipid/cholesterol/gamma-HCH transport system permease protein